jgi:response regulator RpfG family c-di-GMP phosphodiesterase
MGLKTKILYVDDEEHNLLLFKSFLSEEYEILIALDVYGGFELLNKNPDTSVVFSDLQMPEMDGIEFIKRAKEKYPQKKYVLITSLSITNPRIQHVLDTKLIIKHLKKPINKNQLIDVINM